METTLIDWLHQLGTLEFWEALLEGFEGLGPLVPILLAMLESIFPPLPLIAIVALNIAAHGGFLGFVYSWLGVARRHGGVFILAAGGQTLFLEAGLSLRTAEKGPAVGQPCGHGQPLHAGRPALYAHVVPASGLWHLGF